MCNRNLGKISIYLLASLCPISINFTDKLSCVVCFGFQVPAVYEEMITSGCTPDRKAREMLRSALKYMKRSLKS